jgi:hypothetical protein
MKRLLDENPYDLYIYESYDHTVDRGILKTEKELERVREAQEALDAYKEARLKVRMKIQRELEKLAEIEEGLYEYRDVGVDNSTIRDIVNDISLYDC